jgi:hypothetical protein
MAGPLDDALIDDRGEDEAPEDELGGSTSVLTAEGWEAALYVAPGDDWIRQPDGSYASPDGMTRSWPPGTPIE